MGSYEEIGVQRETWRGDPSNNPMRQKLMRLKGVKRRRKSGIKKANE